MSAILQIGDRHYTAEEILVLAANTHLLPQLVREIIIQQAIAHIRYTSSELEKIYEQLYRDEHLYSQSERQAWQQSNSISQEQLNAFAIRKLKLEKFKHLQWGDRIESYFNHRREQLDQVIYWLIQTNNSEIAQELFFRIQEGEQSFAELAKHYSQGSETQTAGLRGPVRLSRLPSKLARVLRQLQPGQLFPPFRVSKYFVIVRLEQFIVAQLDEPMRQQLLNELFDTWLQKQVEQKISSVQIKRLDKSEANAKTPTALPVTTGVPKNASVSTHLPPLLPPYEQNKQAETIILKRWVGGVESTLADLLPANEEIVKETAKNAAPKLEVRQLEINDPLPIAERIGSDRHVTGIQRLLFRRWGIKSQPRLQWVATLLLCLVTFGLGGVYFRSPEKTVSSQLPLSVAFIAKNDTFREAINQADKAAHLVQSAQSQEEWRTVVQTWQHAIELMKAVENSSPNYTTAQQKVTEYQGYLEYAQQKVAEVGQQGTSP